MLRIYTHLNHVRVRGKSLILIGLMAISFLSVITIVGHYINNLEHIRTQKQRLDQISNMINQLAFNTFELHLHMSNRLNDTNKNTDQLTQFDSFMQQKVAMVTQNITSLKRTFHQSNSISRQQEIEKPILAIETLLNELQDNYQSALELKQQIGFNENEGTMGRLRSLIHILEHNLTSNNQYPALVDLLQLRRREKDFIMRGHTESLTLFQEAIQTLHTSIDQLPDTTFAGIQETRTIIRNYQQEAEKLQLIIPRMASHQQALLRINNNILNNAHILTAKNQALMTLHADTQEETLLSTGFSLVLSLSLAYLLLGWITYLFFQSILTPIKLLSHYADQISKGQYNLKLTLYGTDEIGELAGSLQTMKEALLGQHKFLEEQVKRRTEHLEITNTVLNDTIKQLNATHKELLHSEKMASLGRLVAGFAHEINTPIGISVTTISNIPELTRQLQLLLAQEEIDEQELQEILFQLEQSAALGLSSIRKAANLVSHFKRTSADQSSEEARTFNVYEVIQDILSTLNTTFKKTRIAINLLCPTNITIRSQPGLIAQILTNLMMNSFIHGFNNGTQEGEITIRIDFNASTKLLQMRYSDNGVGIPVHHLNTIFEPFYTTARDTGGTGLGLTICYNIVTTQLRGEIVCHSETGQGVAFIIRIPIHSILPSDQHA